MTSSSHPVRAASALSQMSLRSQRTSSARVSVLATAKTLLGERIRLTQRQSDLRAQPVVGREELIRVADVVPLAREPVCIDRRPRVQPGDEVARLVGRIAVREILVDERGVLAGVQVCRGRGECARGLRRLLDEADDAIVLVDFDDAVELRELDVADVAYRDQTAPLLSAPRGDE